MLRNGRQFISRHRLFEWSLHFSSTQYQAHNSVSSITPLPTDTRQIRSWEHIRTEVLARGDLLQTRDLTITMNTLKKLPEQIPRFFLQELASFLLVKASELSPREASDVIHACAKMKFINKELIHSLSQCIVSGQCPIHGFDNRGLSTLVYSLGQLHVLSSEFRSIKEVQQLIHQILKEFQAPYRVEDLESQQISNLLCGLKQTNVDLEDTEVRRGLEYIVELGFKPEFLKNFTEQGFSGFLFGLKELEMKCTNEQLMKLEMELSSEMRIQSFSQQGLCKVMSSLQFIGYTNPEILSSLAELSIHPARLEKYNGQDLASLIQVVLSWDLLGQEKILGKYKNRLMKENIIAHLKEQDLALLLYSFAKSGMESKDPVFGKLIHEAVKTERLSVCSAQCLSLIFYSIGLVKFHSLPVLHALGEETRKHGRLSAFSDQSLSNIIYGLGRLRITEEGLKTVLIEPLIQEAQRPKRLLSFTAQGLANVIYSLAQVQLKTHLSPVLKEALKSPRLLQQSDQGLSNIFQSMCWLGYHDRQSIKGILGEVKRRLESNGLTEFASLNFIRVVLTLDSNLHQFTIQSFLRALLHKKRLPAYTSHGIILVLDKLVDKEKEIRQFSIPLVSELALFKKQRVQSMSLEQISVGLRFCWKFGITKQSIIESFVSRLVQEDHWMSLEAKALAEIILSLCWLQYPNHKLISTFCQDLTTENKLTKLDLSQIIGILQSLKTLVVAQVVVEKFVDHLCTKEKLESLDNHQIVSLLQSQATLHLKDSNRILLCLEELSQSARLPSLTLRDLALSLESLLTLGVIDSELINKLVMTLESPVVLEKVRVHYIAKMIICLTELGREYKPWTEKLLAQLLAPPFRDSVAEKDLTEILHLFKRVDYEYGAVGGLLNHRKQQRKDQRLELNLMQAPVQQTGVV